MRNRKANYDNNAECPKKYKDFELELSLEIPEGRITGFVGKTGQEKVQQLN